MNFSHYDASLYIDSLKTICSTLELDYTQNDLSKDHKTFFNIVSIQTNQEKFQSYWFKDFDKGVWDFLRVIESFQCVNFGLSKNFVSEKTGSKNIRRPKFFYFHN